MRLAKDVRAGNIFKRDDRLFLILKAKQHKSTSGRRASAMEMKLKITDILSKNYTGEITIDADDKLDVVILDKHLSTFMYKDSSYHFMNQETFEQFEIDEQYLGNAIHFLKDNIELPILFFEGRAVSIELPHSIVMNITYTEPALKGDTTGKTTKPATLESGLQIQVPLFCTIGDKIRVNTDTLEYMERG